MNAATTNPFHGARRHDHCPLGVTDEPPVFLRFYYSSPRRPTLPDSVSPTSPETIGRLLGIAVASGLRRPTHRSYENDPLYWIDFMSEAAVLGLIHTTGGGLWRVDIGRIDCDDDSVIEDVMDAVVRMCNDEFRRLNPRFDNCSGHNIITSMIEQSVADSWRTGIALATLITDVRADYPAIKSEIDRALAHAHAARMGRAE